jgi:hypothetical protein
VNFRGWQGAGVEGETPYAEILATFGFGTQNADVGLYPPLPNPCDAGPNAIGSCQP